MFLSSLKIQEDLLPVIQFQIIYLKTIKKQGGEKLKDEKIKIFLEKIVKITFQDERVRKGTLKTGYVKVGDDWKGIGYHLENVNDSYDLGFKKSYVKKIEVV